MRSGIVATAAFATSSLVVSFFLLRRDSPSADFVNSRTVALVSRALPRVRHYGQTENPNKTVLLFLDYVDPRSLNAYLTVDSLLNGDHDLGYVIVSLPKDRLLDHSSEAAADAECASIQGRFVQGIATLMRNTRDPTMTRSAEFAVAAQIPNRAEFDKCLETELPAQSLIRDAALAESVGVANSPVIVVNHHIYQRIPSTAWLARQLRTRH